MIVCYHPDYPAALVQFASVKMGHAKLVHEEAQAIVDAFEKAWTPEKDSFPETFHTP